MGIRDLLADVISGIRFGLHLALPVFCVSCRHPAELLCKKCRKVLKEQGAPNLEETLRRPHIRSTGERHARIPFIARWVYGHVVRDVLLGLKAKKVTQYARPIAKEMFPIFNRILVEDAVIVIPPLSAKSYRERGFDHNRLILKKIGIPRSMVVSAKFLRQPVDQTELSASEREENLTHSMVVSPKKIRGHAAKRHSGTHPVIIFDDIYTTGATVRECVRAVKEAGGEVYAIVVCAVVRKKLFNPMTSFATKG